MKRYVPLIILIVAVMIDGSVIPMLQLPRLYLYMPLLTLVSVVTLGLLLGFTRGLFWGLVGGLLLDILLGARFGLFSIVCIVSGSLAGYTSRRFQRYVITTVAASALCYAFYELVMLIYLYLAGGHITLSLFGPMLIRIGISVVLVQLCYLLFDRMLKTSWSKYAGV